MPVLSLDSRRRGRARRTPGVVAVALTALALVGAAGASAAARVEYFSPLPSGGPMQLSVAGTHIELTVLQAPIGKCNWMVYTQSHVAGTIRHRAFHLHKRFAHGARLSIDGRMVSRSKLTGTVTGVVPGQCTGKVRFVARRV